MSGLLDAMPYPPRLPPPPPPPPLPLPTNDADGQPPIPPSARPPWHADPRYPWQWGLVHQSFGWLRPSVRCDKCPRRRVYDKPLHMPVLMSTRVLREMEGRWAREFRNTRRSKLRLGEEIETNFLYHHYLRLQRFPVASTPGGRARSAQPQRSPSAPPPNSIASPPKAGSSHTPDPAPAQPRARPNLEPAPASSPAIRH